MWYVLQVRAGMEEKIKMQCLKVISRDILEQCFIPYYKEKKKYQGAWHIKERILFPGYIFMVSSQLKELYENIHKIIGVAKLIGTGREIIPLKEEEVNFLKRIGIEEGVIEISIGIIENGVVTVVRGPLIGFERYIRKIDRHKRKAWLEIEVFNRVVEMEVGLEIIMKK